MTNAVTNAMIREKIEKSRAMIYDIDNIKKEPIEEEKPQEKPKKAKKKTKFIEAKEREAKGKQPDSNIYWDINKSISRNCLFNFIVGNRGAGKTFGAKKFVISRFIKTQEQFIYIRRYKTELKKIKQFFADIQSFFPTHTFNVKGSTFFIDGEPAGYAMALSNSKIEKSTSYPNVSTIIFDEFILDKGYHHYLPDEVTYFLEAYETIARTRDNVRVYFLSNALTITNPYFLYFKIELPTAKDNVRVQNDILIEMVQNKEFIEFKNNTRFGKLVQGTKYGDYAINNVFFRDDKSFIEKKSGKCSYYFGYTFLGKDFGIWIAPEQGKMFVSHDVDANFPYKFALTKSDHNPNTLLIESMRKYTPFKFFLKQFQMGNVYFESMDIKNMCYDMFAMAQLVK